MAIYRLIHNSKFLPVEVTAMSEAYEQVLVQLGITDRVDPRTEGIAVAILHLLREGETDPTMLAHLASRAVAPRSTSAEQGSNGL